MNRYHAAAIALSCFLAAQIFQALASAYGIPPAHSPQAALQTYLLPLNQLRAALVGLTILLLTVPYAVLCLRYFRAAPIVSLLALVFAIGFLGAEFAQRSVDFFLIGASWARAFSTSSPAAQATLLQHFDFWNQFTNAWYFPLLTAHLIATCCFLRITCIDWHRGACFRLAPLAFLLNALRLLGRLLSMFAGQTWLNPFNDTLYLPSVLAVNGLLIAWFLHLPPDPPALTKPQPDPLAQPGKQL